jgi:hypothetical protein
LFYKNYILDKLLNQDRFYRHHFATIIFTHRSTTRYNKHVGTADNLAQKIKGRREKQKRKKNSHHALSTPKRRIPRSTFKKGCDNEDAAVQIGPRVSPGTHRGVEKGRPSRRKSDTHRRHRVGAGHPTRISTNPQKTTTRDAAPNSSSANSCHHDHTITAAVSS